MPGYHLGYQIKKRRFHVRYFFFVLLISAKINYQKNLKHHEFVIYLVQQIVKERIEGGANEKAVLRLFINCPFVCINFDFFWLNKARQLYMDF